MSQTPKRSGVRDISELKARLGLKKGGPASKRAPGQGGVVPPPGARSAAIPAPPGVQPPRPAGPDPSEDPFGAMNAIAAQGARAAAPEIVVVNDGKPVESVEQRSRAVTYGRLAAIVVVPLVVGIVVGKISANADVYNQTIVDAAKIRDDVVKIGKGLLNVQNTLLIGKEHGPGGKSFLPNDKKLTAALKKVPVVKPNMAVPAHSFLYELDPEIVTAVFSFYVDTANFYKALKHHIQQTERDATALDLATAKLKNFTPFTYGAYISIPTADQLKQGAHVAVRLVQLGSPVCQDGKVAPSCSGPPRGFRYRPDPTGPWGVMELAPTGGGSSVPGKKLLLLDPNKILQSLLEGSEASVAQMAYIKRIRSLEKTLTNLIKRRKYIVDHLTNEANEGKKFSFFM